MSALSEDVSPFEAPAARRAADTLGMFIFLTSEVMLFGGLFALMAWNRIHHPGAAAEASKHLKMWLGTANTAVLLTSSLLVALGALAAKDGKARSAGRWLLLAAALGLVFLAIKAVEYRTEYLEGLMPLVGKPSPVAGQPAELFIGLYFVSTALHAIHVTGGIVLLGATGVALLRRKLPVPQRAETVHVVGLYWHLVDVIWVFLFPLLYLAR